MTGPFFRSVATSTVIPLAFFNRPAGAVADLQHRASEGAVTQLFDVTLHHDLALRRYAPSAGGALFGEFFFQRHIRSRAGVGRFRFDHAASRPDREIVRGPPECLW